MVPFSIGIYQSFKDSNRKARKTRTEDRNSRKATSKQPTGV